MKKFMLALVCGLLGFGPAIGKEARVPKVIVDGEAIVVNWQDGDSFRAAPPNKARYRITRYNTLESFAPVHRWGAWTREELLGLAKQGAVLAESKDWECSTLSEGLSGEKKDYYGRILLRCPGLAAAMIQSGLAHANFYRGDRSRELLEFQKTAQAAKLGIWAKGIPNAILTSVHGADEPGTPEGRLPSNRMASTLTGNSIGTLHDSAYTPCSEICMRGSCMLYIPHHLRGNMEKLSCVTKEPTGTSPALESP